MQAGIPPLVITPMDLALVNLPNGPHGKQRFATGEKPVGFAVPQATPISAVVATAAAKSKLPDCDGRMLLALNKAEFRAQEIESRALRRTTNPARLDAYLGQEVAMLDVENTRKVSREAQDEDAPYKPALDHKPRISLLPAITSRLGSFLRFESDLHDPKAFSFEAFLPTSTIEAAESLEEGLSADSLRIAFENFDLCLQYLLSDKYANVTADARALLSAPELTYSNPRHLWYAAKVVWGKWTSACKSDQAAIITSTWSAQGDRCELAANLLKDELARQFTTVNIFSIRDKWAEILRNRKASLDLRARPLPTTSTNGSDGSDKTPSKGKGAKSDIADPPKPTIDPTRMCTVHAKSALGIEGAKVCDKAKTGCLLKHYDLGGMQTAQILGLIKKHGSNSAKKTLCEAAESAAKRPRPS